MTPWSNRALSILRIVTGLLFLEHGLMKLIGFPVLQAGGPLSPLLLSAGTIEIVGGALLALGLFTRVMAFLCAGEMAVAYFVAHLPLSFWPGVNGGDAAILFCFIFLYLSCSGAGPWSVDSVWKLTYSKNPG